MTKAIWNLRDVSSTEKFVLLALDYHADGGDFCIFSAHRISGDTGLTDRAIRNALRSLERLGHVSGFRGRDGDGLIKKFYRLHPGGGPAKQQGLAESSVVYCVQQGEGGPVKIGWSTAVAERLKALQCASAYPLRLLWTLRGGAHQERRLHDQLGDLRLSGEWFKPEAKDRLAAMGVPS